MRLLFFFSFFCLLQTHSVNGQELAYSPTAFANNDYAGTSLYASYHRRDDNKAIRTGKVLLIVGGSGMLAGGGLVGIGILQTRYSSPDRPYYGLGTVLVGAVLFTGGFWCGVAGLGVFIAGKRHQLRNDGRYSIIGTSNQLGVAYNF